VLIDIAHRREPEGVERIFAFMHGNPEGFGSVEEAADAVAEYLPHRPRPSNIEGLRRNLRLGPDGRYRWHWDPQTMAGGGPRKGMDANAFGNLVRKLTLPVLLVRGGRSDILSPETAAEFLSLVPHAEFADVGDAHHMVAGDQNDAFLYCCRILTRVANAGADARWTSSSRRTRRRQRPTATWLARQLRNAVSRRGAPR
jgi:pimeloyl-ACP methyl ester carboxylesterase